MNIYYKISSLMQLAVDTKTGEYTDCYMVIRGLGVREDIDNETKLAIIISLWIGDTKPMPGTITIIAPEEYYAHNATKDEAVHTDSERSIRTGTF